MIKHMYLAKAISAFEGIKDKVDAKMKAITEDEQLSPAFYMGPSGYYMLGALIYQEDSSVDRTKDID